MNENQTINLPAIMSLSQWQAAERKAGEDVCRAVHPPQERDFTAASFSKYPRWLSTGMGIVLILVASGAFWISAGKQIVASDMAMGYLTDSSRLSASYVSIAIVCGLLFGELGTFLFGLASAIYDGQAVKMVFRVAALVCAAFAVISNVTVTALHVHQQQDIAAYVWFITVAAPVLVLALSLALERQVLAVLDERAKAATEFEIARRAFDGWRLNPASHPDYQRYLCLRVMEVYRRKLGTGNTILNEPEIIQAVFIRDVTVYGALPNFTQLPSGSTTPALPPTVEPMSN